MLRKEDVELTDRSNQQEGILISFYRQILIHSDGTAKSHVPNAQIVELTRPPNYSEAPRIRIRRSENTQNASVPYST